MQMLLRPSPKTFQRFPTRVRLSFLCFALNYSSRAPSVSSDTWSRELSNQRQYQGCSSPTQKA